MTYEPLVLCVLGPVCWPLYAGPCMLAHIRGYWLYQVLVPFFFPLCMLSPTEYAKYCDSLTLWLWAFIG